MSEEENYEEALSYKDGTDDEVDDVKVYKIGSVILVDSGAAVTPVNDSIELVNQRKVKATRLEYADECAGREKKNKGNFKLNGHRVPAFISPDLSQKLLTSPQIDRFLGRATILFDSRSVTFIFDKNQRKTLKNVCTVVMDENLVINAKLNEDGLSTADTDSLTS